MAALTELTCRTPVLLTGDNERAARRLAAEVGIGDVRAGLLPQDKVAAVRAWEAEGLRVLVVGDGVNDAPALAAAHTGIAMGRAGSDLALETADAVVVRDELATVPAVVALSRTARRLVVQNLVIAGTFIAVLVAWDLIGTLPCRSASPGTRAPPSSSASTASACCARPPGTGPPYAASDRGAATDAGTEGGTEAVAHRGRGARYRPPRLRSFASHGPNSLSSTSRPSLRYSWSTDVTSWSMCSGAPEAAAR